ncbi:MAG TPA: SDR family NAD(P)-dependent oxidoreductase [Terriglobia bacterium]|nr:SDR family NAD(P)-dependent oxidoreductase [Terriglobia bacterium]
MAGKRALVTGGTRGIGAATALALREWDYEVFVTGRSPDGQAPAGCFYLSCDFGDRTAVEEFAGKVRDLNLSVLVNNAGINKIGVLADYDPADFALIQQVNVITPFILCQAVVPGMRSRHFGRIVNITSIFSVVSKAGRSAYSASKFSLVGLTRALALEVAAENVLVNCLAPGVIDTELTRRVLGDEGIREIVAEIPMRRMARADEIARYVRFLVSDENTYMTGQNIVVDGGYTCA